MILGIDLRSLRSINMPTSQSEMKRVQALASLRTGKTFVALDLKFSKDHSKIKHVSIVHFSVPNGRFRQISALTKEDPEKADSFRVIEDGLPPSSAETDKALSSKIRKFLGQDILRGFSAVVVATCKDKSIQAMENDGESCPELKALLKSLLRDAVDLQHMLETEQEPPTSSKAILRALMKQYGVSKVSEEPLHGNHNARYLKEITSEIVKGSSQAVHKKEKPDQKSPKPQRCPAYDQGQGYVMIVAQSKFEDEKLYRERNVKEDISTIKETFKGHKIHLIKNKTKEEIDEEIEKAVAALNDPESEYKFFVWFSLSHGGICEAKVSKDDPKVEVDYMVDIKGNKIFFYKDIVKKYSNSACSGLTGKFESLSMNKKTLGLFCLLLGKPRMFVLQNCRGEKPNVPSPFESDAAVFDEVPTIGSATIKESSLKEPDIGDYIIFHATLPGNPSYRHREDGSILVQKLCKSVNEFPEEDLLSHSSTVLAEIAQEDKLPNGDVQVCEVSHTLRKRFVIGNLEDFEQ